MIDFGDLISRLRTLSHWTTLVKPMRDVQEEAASAIEILLSRTEGQKNRIDDLKEGIDKLLAEKNALRDKQARMQKAAACLIEVLRMPNAEHVADAHNAAVRLLKGGSDEA